MTCFILCFFFSLRVGVASIRGLDPRTVVSGSMFADDEDSRHLVMKETLGSCGS